MVCYKLFYYAYILVLPILLLDVAWYHVVLGIVTMHALAGFILGLVFQPAHVVPDTDFPLPNTDNVVEGDWFIHQLYTTANFANDNHILNWYVGGLNFQIEHHLFPTISHVHYRALSKIVRSTAEEYGVPYNYQPTFVGAVINHAKMLYKLGKA
jgi:linoleoyl-CoA desaturase